MPIRVEPTLICDNCFTPIEVGERFFNIYSAEFVRIENPAYAEPFADYRDVKADTYIHGKCFVPTVTKVVDGVLDELFPDEDLDDEALHECGPDCDAPIYSDAEQGDEEESDAAEPVDTCDFNHVCCGDEDCWLCHSDPRSFAGMPTP